MAQRNPKIKLPRPPAQQLYGAAGYKRAGDGAAASPGAEDHYDAHIEELRLKKLRSIQAKQEQKAIRRGGKGRYLPDHVKDRANKDRAFGGSGYRA